MTAPNELIFLPLWPLLETEMGFLCNCLMGVLTLRDPIIPLVRSKGSPPRTDDLTQPPVAATAKKKKKTACPLVV